MKLATTTRMLRNPRLALLIATVVPMQLQITTTAQPLWMMVHALFLDAQMTMLATTTMQQQVMTVHVISSLVWVAWNQQLATMMILPR